jgi:predicted DsbA family dithiol-disulfide isomerase
MTAQPVRIDFVSDIACPWCVVGLGGLLQALETLRGEVSADIHLHPFELNPHMGPEGQNTFEHVRAKYGSTPERSAAARQAIKERGAEVGFTFNYSPESRIWNTFDAHRLLHWAALEGKQIELKQALFKSTFTDQRPSNDPDALAAAAAEAGLDPNRAREVLQSGAYAREVREEEELWRSRGINAVPSIIINDRWLIQGGQPAQVFERALRQIATGQVKQA